MYYNTKASGARIRELRLAKKLDQIELAELLNVSHGYISRIESGKKGCSVDLMIQISEIFGTSLDYLILGNHYDHDDEHGFYFGHTRTAEQIRRYVDSAVKGMETGMFAYLAHPDLFMRDYGRPLDADGRAAAKELCQACKALNMPMEYNLHDRFLSPITHRKSYPDADFFDIVRQEGVRVLIGLDAHEPEEIRNPAQWDRAMKELEPFGALREDHLEL